MFLVLAKVDWVRAGIYVVGHILTIAAINLLITRIDYLTLQFSFGDLNDFSRRFSLWYAPFWNQALKVTTVFVSRAF